MKEDKLELRQDDVGNLMYWVGNVPVKNPSVEDLLFEILQKWEQTTKKELDLKEK